MRTPTMRALRLLLALSCLTLITGCTAPPPSAQTPQATGAQPSPPPAAITPVTTPATPAAPAAKPAKPAPGIEHAPLASTPLIAPNHSCKTDADCTVKDIGNCCGYYPMCMNKDAKTSPAAVRAQCEKDGVASVCGFPDISGCQCVKGQCENLTNGAAVM